MEVVADCFLFWGLRRDRHGMSGRHVCLGYWVFGAQCSIGGVTIKRSSGLLLAQVQVLGLLKFKHDP